MSVTIVSKAIGGSGKMIRIGRWLASAGLVIALIAAPLRSTAQQAKSGSVDDLLKSIGLVKPAMSTAPDFNLLDSNGSPVGLSGYRGKMVLLNFWATWCGPCREEMPSMEQLSRSFGGQGLVVLAINQRENAALVNKFMRTYGLNFTTPVDTTGRVAGYYRVYGIPVSYLIDANGQAIGMKSGPMDWASPVVVNVFRKLVGDRADAGASIALEPAKPLPATLRAKSDGVVIRGQQDMLAEAVGKIDRSEELIPFGKVSGAGEFWYMVKTKSGGVGWVRGGDVEEVGVRK
jgi:cytochrome c biogenesis protein CcmG/thiol:disulfide interchange protein DsbE